MSDPPRFVLLCHRVFNASVSVACLMGLAGIWLPWKNELLTKAFGSVLVLLAGSMLVLAAHRTVCWRIRPD